MKTKSIIYVIVAGVLWGTSGIFVHYLAPFGFTSLQMTATRAAVSFLGILGYVLIAKRELLRVKFGELPLLLGIGASLFGTGGCYFLSMQMTSVSTAVVLMYMAPIYVLIFSVLFFGEKLTKGKLVSVVLMLMGCCLVSGIVGGLKFDATGILLGFASGISYGAYNILTKIAMRRGMAPVSVTLYAFATMTAISLFVSEPARYAESVLREPVATIPLLLALGVCTFIVPYFLYTLAMKELPAGTVSSLGIVEPMSATLFSVALFGETLDVFSALGIALIIFAVFLLGRSEEA